MVCRLYAFSMFLVDEGLFIAGIKGIVQIFGRLKEGVW
jgi:hypothetical protein